MACDLRITGEGARFALPEVRLGGCQAAAACSASLELVGPARKLMYLGEPIDAEEQSVSAWSTRLSPTGRR